MQLQWQPLLALECKLLDLGLVPLFSQMILKIERLWMYLREKMMKKLLHMLIWQARVCPRARNIRGLRVRA
jgi:hypothetical protein